MMSLALGGLMLGIAGSMHCVGMCGPLVMALPAADESVGKRLVNRATYTIARITVYAAMGAIVGGVGGISVIGLASGWLGSGLLEGVLVWCGCCVGRLR